jgi:hypothetical protein
VILEAGKPVMTTSRVPLNINYETDNCIVRELEVTDPLDVICGWMARPDIAHGLNAPARQLDLEELRKFVASRNRIDSHALGVFDRATGKLVGMWTVYVDWSKREFLLNVLLAERVPGAQGGLRETGRPLYAIMFVDLGMETLVYNVMANNEEMIGRLPSTPTRVTEVPSVNGGTGRVQMYRVTRKEYFEIRSRRAERDAEFDRKREERRRLQA